MNIMLRRTMIAIATTAIVGFAFASDEASARRGGGAGLRGAVGGAGIRTAGLGGRDLGRPGRPDLGLPGRPGLGLPGRPGIGWGGGWGLGTGLAVGAALSSSSYCDPYYNYNCDYYSGSYPSYDS